MTRTRIKFCGFVDPDDVRDACAIGADAIGFVFYEKSPRAVNLDQVIELRKLLPSWVSAVGLFVNASIPEITDIQRQIGLDVFQLHGDESADFGRGLSKETGAAWWKAIRCKAGTDLSFESTAYADAEATLLDSFSPAYGGSGHAFDWSALDGIDSQTRRRMILSGGLTVENVRQALEICQTFAVDVSSGIQVPQNPRRKDRKRMEDFVAAVLSFDSCVK